MQGHYNAASEDRKPLMINFDDDDNLVSTELLHWQSYRTDLMEGRNSAWISGNWNWILCVQWAKSYWMEARTIERRNGSLNHQCHQPFIPIGLCKSRRQPNIVRTTRWKLKPESLVLFVDDPGGQDSSAEKEVSSSIQRRQCMDDYRNVIALVLEDGIISPSEDQMMWVMRQQLGIKRNNTWLLFRKFLVQTPSKNVKLQSNGWTLPWIPSWYCQPCEVIV